MQSNKQANEKKNIFPIYVNNNLIDWLIGYWRHTEKSILNQLHCFHWNNNVLKFNCFCLKKNSNIFIIHLKSINQQSEMKNNRYFIFLSIWVIDRIRNSFPFFFFDFFIRIQTLFFFLKGGWTKSQCIIPFIVVVSSTLIIIINITIIKVFFLWWWDYPIEMSLMMMMVMLLCFANI